MIGCLRIEPTRALVRSFRASPAGNIFLPALFEPCAAACRRYRGARDILIGLDNKITYGPAGQINGAPGNDAVLVVDISDPRNPKSAPACR